MTTDDIVSGVLELEGGFVNHPSDRGGPTNYGITAANLGQWRRLGRPATVDEVQQLSIAEARAILVTEYVAPFAWVTNEQVHVQLVDFGVHSGPRTAIKEVQGVIGVGQDGYAGPITAAAMAVVPWRLVNNALVAARCLYLSDICERDASQRVFLRGWIRRATSFYIQGVV